MGRYRARDLLGGPTLLSLVRVPLGVGFFVVVDRPPLALAVIAISGITDVVDGRWARSSNQVTATGAAIDPLTDKWFVGCVIVALLAAHKLSWLALAALATRELGELPLVLWMLVSRTARRSRVETPMANVPGKVVTILQFVAVTAALFASRFTVPLLWVTAVAGIIAALEYWRRALSAHARVSRV